MACCSAVNAGKAESRPSPGIFMPRYINTAAITARADTEINTIFFIFMERQRPIMRKNARHCSTKRKVHRP